MYVVVQAPCLSFILDWKFQKYRFHKYKYHCLHPLEFTSTSYFLILKIWRPPLILHSPLFGGRDYIKKIIWVSECIQFIEKIFFLIFNLNDLFLYGNLYCRLLFRPHVCLLFLIGNLGREQNLLKPGPGTQALGR